VVLGNALSSARVASFLADFYETSSLPTSYTLTVDAAKLEALSTSIFTPIPLSHLIVPPPSSSSSSSSSFSPHPAHDETNAYYSSLSAPPSLAVGVITHYNNTAHRLAARQTWLSLPHSPSHSSVTKFFIAMPPEGVHALSQATLVEALAFDDILLLPFPDSYSKTPIKSVALFAWGVEIVGASFVLRANDDVYLDLRPTMATLYATVPSRVIAGHLISGKAMRIPRPEHHGLKGREGQKTLLTHHRAWTFTYDDWACDAVPDFAQGNAVLLSSDLAYQVGKLRHDGFRKLEFVADDILVGLIVDQVVGDNKRSVSVPTGYVHEGGWVTCADDNEWFFNIHPEYNYKLHENIVNHLPKCNHVDLIMCCGIQG
jgi:hypothetical protein